jgi:isoleucyl-tRNA synthetase
MSKFPDAKPFVNAFDEVRSKDWERLLGVREEVLKALEQARAAKLISGALEARVALAASGDARKLIEKYAASLPALFIVSQVELLPAGSHPDGLRVEIKRADGAKCERCWNYSTHVGESADYPTFCERCVAALAEIERDGGLLAGSAKS